MQGILIYNKRFAFIVSHFGRFAENLNSSSRYARSTVQIFPVSEISVNIMKGV